MNFKKRLQIRFAVFFAFFVVALIYQRLNHPVPSQVAAPVANSESGGIALPPTSMPFPTLAPIVVAPPLVAPTALPGMPTPTPYPFQHDIDQEHAMVAAGKNGIQDMMKMIEWQSPWSPNTTEIVPELASLGDPAHQALLKAIPLEKDKWRRIHLIGALQEAFHDFREIGLWVPYLTQCPGTAPWLGRELYTDYHWRLPIVLAMNRGPVISPRFVIWYKQVFPGKPLPA